MKKWLIVASTLFCYSFSFSQILEKQGQLTSFSNRIQNPVEVEVTRTKEELTFHAKNKSVYPYELELEFKVLQNLTPMMTRHKTVLHPGINRLFKLKIQDLSAPPNYSYSVRYKIANSREDADLSFPYLIPLKPGVKMESYTWENETVRSSITSSFKGLSGDTVFAVRKGVVTSLPSDTGNDKIGQGTFEVIHSDGTIALYTGLDLQSLFLKAGQRVYPGQPIGTISDLNYVVVYIYRVLDNGLQPLPVFFATNNQDKERYADLQNIVVQHPPEIIQKELSDREKKKFNKRTLYSSND